VNPQRFHLACVLLTACHAQPSVPATTPRIITVGAAITETVFALGAENDVVGVDTTSVFPARAAALPKVGFGRQLGAEGLLALKPTTLLLSLEAGPPAVLQQLKQAGVRLHVLADAATPEGARSRILQAGEALGRTAEAQALLTSVDEEWRSAQAIVRSATSSPRVLFIYARGAGTVLGAGGDTPASEMIRLAGGINALQDQRGFKPLSAESLLVALPDIIVLPTHGLTSLGGKEAILTMPGVAQTPAGKAGRIVDLDAALIMGFTPRFADGVTQLARAIHPELSAAGAP